jgi:flagellar L-ring protein precursor FlgH
MMKALTSSTALARTLTLGALCLSLAGCGAASRIAEIGQPPAMSGIQNPRMAPGYTPVTMPMPPQMETSRSANSLWRTGARSFFKDQRARAIGDILTVEIDIDDRAELSNATTRRRGSAETMGLPSFLGLESNLKNVLPEEVRPDSLVDFNSDGSSNGTGTIKRDERVTLKVAAVVTQILPNGNLVIQGTQEVRVNFERRDLNITGVIRPEDITSANAISYDKIAEARISYGGRGQITDVQQPRYGQQLFDIIAPF